MRSLRLVVLILLATLVAVSQTASPAPSLNILAPKSGENIKDSFVTVAYELASQASASSTPTFQLRLDSRDPVQTTDTQYTFTGLAAGTHTITIRVVDANNTPLPGVQNQVQFTIQPPASPQGAAGRAESSGTRLEPAVLTWRQPPNSRSAGGELDDVSQASDEKLPQTGSALPCSR